MKDPGPHEHKFDHVKWLLPKDEEDPNMPGYGGWRLGLFECRYCGKQIEKRVRIS